jgi:ATP-dependent DNA helicase RecQ
MGFDKPDLAFCIHIGSPSSPVAYYQQVGRAGRALDNAVAVLLPSPADERLWDYFATAGIPEPEHVELVLAAIAAGATSVPAIETATKLRRGRIDALLKILAVDDVVARGTDGWAATGTPWVHDAAKWDALRQVREAEADLMRRYAAGAGCLMRFLQLALDDPDPAPCGRCSVCTGDLPAPGATPGVDAIAAARAHLRGLDVVIEPRKLWPGGVPGRKGKIAGCEPGRALAFADDPAWADALAALGHSDGPVTSEIADATVGVLTRWSRSWTRPVAVVPVPSRRRPRLVRSLAEHIATVGKLPLLDVLEVDGPPAPTDVASAARASALLTSLRVRPDAQLPHGPLLLVDDTYRTGWTATVAAALLADRGATSVLPVVIHQLP